MSRVLILSFCCCSFAALGQRMDSVLYDLGYLYFHTYGEGKPVILLSGGPGNSYVQAIPVAKEIGKRHRCILPEQRGTGRSILTRFDSSTINLRTAHQDLIRLMDHLRIKQAVFAGHSWGATLAMSFASSHPEKVSKLILIAPGAHREWNKMFEILRTNMRARLSDSERKRLDYLNEKLEKGNASQDEYGEMRRILRSTYIFNRATFDSLSAMMDVPANAQMRVLMNRDLGKNLDLSTSLLKYQNEIHIIFGRQDILSFAAYEIAIAKPESILHPLNECGHFPFLEKPEEFFQELAEALH